MDKDLFPLLGSLPVADVSAPMLLDALRRIEKRGAIETAHTLRQTAGQVFRYGIQTGRCERSPAPDLHGALQPVQVKHMAAVAEFMAQVLRLAGAARADRRPGFRSSPERSRSSVHTHTWLKG
jgi:hypothetical protein